LQNKLRAAWKMFICISLLTGLWSGIAVEVTRAEVSGDFVYVITNGEARIEGYTGSGGHLEIPETLGGAPVTVLGHYAFSNKNLTSIDIPDTVTTIVDFSFFNNQLTELVIPDGVMQIGVSAFHMNQLTSVQLPNSVTDIGASAFRDNELTTVDIPSGITRIAESAFSGNQLSSLVIPSNITMIFPFAFEGNSLTSIVIPNTVTTLSSGAFENNRLSNVTLSSGLNYISDYAFKNNNLSSIDIPDSVQSIGNGSFENNELTSLDIPTGLTTISNEAFKSNRLTSLFIPDNIAVIGHNAFSENDLTTLFIPDSVLSIGNGAFYDNQLTSLTIEDGGATLTIGENAFEDNLLTELDIPSRVTVLGHSSFQDNLLTSLNLADGSNPLTINHNVFDNNRLTEVEIPGRVTNIGNRSFLNNALTSVIIADGARALAIGQSAFQDNQLESIDIPSRVTSINNSAFMRNPLTSLIIAESGDPLSIFYNVFEQTQLEKVVIPARVTHIDNWSFRNTPLRSIVFHGTGTTFGSSVFQGSPEVKIIAFDSSDAHAYATANDIPYQNILAAGVGFAPNGATSTDPSSTVVTIGDPIPAGLSTSASYKWTTSEEQPYWADGDASWTQITSGPTLTSPSTIGTWYLHVRVASDPHTAGLVHSEAFRVVPSSYTVTFNAQGGSVVDAVTDLLEGAKLEKPADPTRSGYTFDGWYTEAYDGTLWDFGADTVTGDITLYAHWKELYTVTFNAQGGSAVDAVTGLLEGAKLEKPADPTRSGYTFDGWYTEANDGTLWDFGADSVTADMTLYAQWKRNASSGGSGPSPAQPTETPGQWLPAGRAGQFQFNDAVTIDIPDGATAEDLILTIEKVLNAQSLFTNNEIVASDVFEVLKTLPGNFRKPIKLTFIFDPAKIGEGQQPCIFYYDETKKVWVGIGGTVSGGRISVEVDHFTKFAVLAVGQSAVEPVADFTDIAGHWAEDNIQRAVKDGIVGGYPDGTFKPGHSVTRAEFAVMLMNALKPSEASAALKFVDEADIPTWAKQAVGQAVEQGILNGYKDGTFRSDEQITRAEMALMIARAVQLTIDDVDAPSGFADDASIPAWAKGAASVLRELGIMTGTGGNRFNSRADVTRAEAVTVLLQMLEHTSK
jgi:uncharacterized repeat protein (TIGR02543 family)